MRFRCMCADAGLNRRKSHIGRSVCKWSWRIILWFDLCAAGRYLVIAESGSPDIRREMNYQIASHMNELAAYIAALPKEGFMAGI